MRSVLSPFVCAFLGELQHIIYCNYYQILIITNHVVESDSFRYITLTHFIIAVHLCKYLITIIIAEITVMYRAIYFD